MATNLSTISIRATKQRVWDVLTQPALVKLWQYGSDLLTSWQPDSPITFRATWQEQVFEQWGTVLAFHPHASLSYSLFAPAPGREDVPENYFVMHYRLSEENGRTTLEIVQEDNRPGAVQEAPQGEENPVLNLLKEIAEREA